MPSYEWTLILGTLLSLIAIWLMVVALLNQTRVYRAASLMVVAVALLISAELTSPAGARAGEVMPSFFRLLGQAVN